MCQTCYGKGGLTIRHTWGVEFVYCPDSNCDFDREEAWKKTQKTLDRLKRELNINATA